MKDNKLPEGYHSLRAMAMRGPDFNQNLVIDNEIVGTRYGCEEGLIIPIGQVIPY